MASCLLWNLSLGNQKKKKKLEDKKNSDKLKPLWSWIGCGRLQKNSPK